MSKSVTIEEWGWSDSIDEAMGLGPSTWVDSRDLVAPEPLLDDEDEPITDLSAHAFRQADKYGGRAYRREVTLWEPAERPESVN